MTLWGKSVNLLVQKALMHVIKGQKYWFWTGKKKLLLRKKITDK